MGLGGLENFCRFRHVVRQALEWGQGRPDGESPVQITESSILEICFWYLVQTVTPIFTFL